jgi:hypothetical protein
MKIETGVTLPQSAGTNRQNDPAWAAARQLQIAFLTQFLKHGGLGDVFGEGPAGDFSTLALGAIAEDMTETSPQMAERFYKAMKRSV